LEVLGLPYFVQLSLAAEGVYSISLPEGVFEDDAGNSNTAARPLQFVLDLTAPTVSIEMPITQMQLCANGTLINKDTVRLVFTDDMTGLSAVATLVDQSAVSVEILSNPHLHTGPSGSNDDATVAIWAGELRVAKPRCAWRAADNTTLECLVSVHLVNSTLWPAYCLHVANGAVTDRAGNPNAPAVSAILHSHWVRGQDLVCAAGQQLWLTADAEGDLYVCTGHTLFSATAGIAGTSDDNSITTADSVCDFGYFNAAANVTGEVDCRRCTVCQENYYQLENSTCGGSNDYVCAACPNNAISQRGSIGIDACFCAANYYDETWHTGVRCRRCPGNSSSIRGSVDPRHCICDAHFFDAVPDLNGSAAVVCQACRVCPVGEYRTPGTLCGIPAVINGTAIGAQTDFECSTCPGNSTTAAPGSLTVRDCRCLSGFFDARTSAQDAPACTPCTPCAPNEVTVTRCGASNDNPCEELRFTVAWTLSAHLPLPPATVGSPYNMTPPVRVASSLPVASYAGLGLPCGLVVDPGNGILVGIPTRPGSYNVTIQATAATPYGQVGVVNNRAFPLFVRECDNELSCGGGVCLTGDSPFDGDFVCNCSGTGHGGTHCTTVPPVDLQVGWPAYPRIWPRAVVKKPYQAPEPANVTVVPAIGAAEVMRFSVSGLPCGMIIDTRTGRVGGVPALAGNYSDVTIFAEVTGHTAKVNKATFSLEVVDCDSKLSCNGGQCVDNTFYDGAFTCDCSAVGKQGSFCEEMLPPAATTGSDLGGILG